jgi:hypothetical protein
MPRGARLRSRANGLTGHLPAPPSEPINGQQPLLFDVTGALALGELVRSLKHKK